VAEIVRRPRPRFAVAAVDIDDTLVGPDGVISAANAAALTRLVAEGTLVVLASGRSHANMLPFHRALGLPHGPIISSQGAVVQESDSGEVRFSRAISPRLTGIEGPGSTMKASRTAPRKASGERPARSFTIRL